MRDDDLAYHEYYSNWYRNDAATVARAGRFYADLLEPYLPPDRDADILDVGAGIGLLLRSLQELGYRRLQGMEVNAHQQRGAAELSRLIHLADDPVSWLRDRQDRFDLLLCTDVLEHVAKNEQVEFVRAMVGALRPGGRLVCTVPNANSSIASRWRYNDYTHELSFTEGSMELVLRSGGLEQIRVHEAPIFQLRSRVFPRLEPILAGVTRKFSRLLRRLDFIGELGVEEGRRVPLSVNLLGTGTRRTTVAERERPQPSS